MCFNVGTKHSTPIRHNEFSNQLGTCGSKKNRNKRKETINFELICKCCKWVFNMQLLEFISLISGNYYCFKVQFWKSSFRVYLSLQIVET